MGNDIRMDSAWWNGKDEDVRSRTYPIDCELHFMEFVSELLCDEWYIIPAAFGTMWQLTTTGETMK